MKLDDLVGAPYNPRRISTEAAAGLAKSIERFGLVQPIIWNRQTGHVVGGHQRVSALRAPLALDPAVSRGHYHWQHEPCWYAVRKGTSAKWCGDRTQSTIWDIARKDATTEKATVHGTQKPVECMARPIRNHGDKNDAVYDPFLGSGTTLIAAEQLGRTCVGLELDPKYVDVICLRFEQLTGIKAVRVPADPSLLEPRQDPPGDRSTPIV